MVTKRKIRCINSVNKLHKKEYPAPGKSPVPGNLNRVTNLKLKNYSLVNI